MTQPFARIAAAILLLLATPAWAEKRAFVVGVNAYPKLAAEMQLQRPIADASAVGDTLGRLGFKVTALTKDVDERGFWRSFKAFSNDIEKGDTVLFFFAGHGAAIEGANYLIPGDIEAFLPGEEQSLTGHSIAESAIVETLRVKASVAILVIDACRNNPFPKKPGQRAMGTERGLSPSQPPSGVYSLYSAGWGQTALDSLSPQDPAKNSVFTRIFINELAKPNVNLVDLGENVRDRVEALARKEAQHDQVPAANNNVLHARDVFLAGKVASLGNVAVSLEPVVTPPVVVPPVVTAPVVKVPVAALDPGLKPIPLQKNLSVLGSAGAPPQLLLGHSKPVRAISLSPDGTLIASGSGDETIRLWNMGTGQPQGEIRTGAQVLDVAFGPSGQTLASAGFDNVIRIWTIAGAPLRELRGHAGPVNAIAFSPDGKRLVSVSNDKTVRIWEVASGRMLTQVSNFKQDVKSLALSPDGRLMATGGITQTIRIMDATTGQLVREMPGHFFSTSAVRFSPDGKQLATGGEDSDARLWDVATGKELFVMRGHKGGIDALAFSEDGRRLATGSWDSTARLWDTASGSLLQEFKGGSGIMNSLALSRDSQRLITGSGDAKIRIWAVK